MARSAELIQIPNLDKRFVASRNPDDHWLLDRFHENVGVMNKLAASLPRKMPWRAYRVEEHKAMINALREKGRTGEAYRFHWQEMLDAIQAFGLLSAWRQAELASSAIWALRRNDPLCAALLSRAAIETTASYAWFMSRYRPPLEGMIGKEELNLGKELEEELLKTLWASRLEDAEGFYKPTNIVTVITHITKKIPHQEVMGTCYAYLCEVAHPNMAGRSIYLSADGGETVISRRRGPTTRKVETEAMIGLSWACGTMPGVMSALQGTCSRLSAFLNQFGAKMDA